MSLWKWEKYKKTCLKKDAKLETEQFTKVKFDHLLSYEDINEMETDEIVSRLEEMNIPFDEKEFLEDVEESYSAQDISEKWFRLYPINAIGRDQDYPWFAAWILWERLAPAGHLSMEQLADFYEDGVDYLEEGDVLSGCDKWLEFWETIKIRNNSQYKNLDYLDEQNVGAFYVSEVCQNLELELHNAGNKNSVYYEKRITFRREFCDMFPEEEELILRNMRVAIAESYSKLGQDEQAESEYIKIIEDFPNSPWGYVSWGDTFFLTRNKNLDKAKELYQKAKVIAKDEDDISAINQRLESIKAESSKESF